MASTPCGCDLEVEAEESLDPREKKVLLSDAKLFKEKWGCGKNTAPDQQCSNTLKNVRSLIGAESEELSCCPGKCMRESDAYTVLESYNWLKKGQLQLRNPWPSSVLVEALDILETSVSSRERAEIREATKEQDQAWQKK